MRIPPRALLAPGASLVLVVVLAAAPAHAQTKLLRFPDIHGETIVFSYAGDLWRAPSSGGTATRLTAHPGQELFAKFSPDGRWIAFTGQYDGDEQVYAIPAEGGVPKQLTFYPARGPMAPRWGYDHQVYGWTPDGKSVLFRSSREGFTVADGRLYVVDVEGGLPRPLPMLQAGAGDFSPDGRRLAYSPLDRDFRAWKRYEGGWAQDLWIIDLTTNEAANFTNQKRTDRDPMWIGDTIYFASDRDGTLNLYAYGVSSGRTTQVTHSTEWDVRWPSSDGRGQIVYELGGELQVFDLAAGDSRDTPILVPDDGVAMRPSRVSAEKQIEDFELAPGGERALFVARGDVFTAPIEKGPTRNLTRTSGAHDKWARWSPDGTQVAFVSDQSGEDEIWVVPQDGSEAPRQLTRNGQVMRYAAEWSPDGTRLAFSDKNGKLFVLTVADGSMVEVADESRNQVRHYVWSPDSRWLAFSLTVSDRARSISIWSRADGATRRVTGELFDEYGVAWDPEGAYLFYLSDREYAPQISTTEWNFATDRQTSIFALALRKDVPHPFPPESDEVGAESEAAGEENGDGKDAGDKKDDKGEKKEEKVEVGIDFEGLADRVARVPVEADNYEGLAATKGHLLYVKTGPFYYGREADVKPSLQIFSRKERKAEALAEDVEGYALSRDGKYVLVRHSEGYARYEAKPKGKDSKKDVSTAGLMVDRVPAQEWAQIFDEVWRRNRDFFYVPNMHGYDWEALRDQYRPLLKYVAHRSDLNYVIGEMIAELSIGHTYIEGGDFEIPERPKVALPGADFELDEGAGRYRLTRIFQGQNEEPRYRAPLTEVGLDAREGDYLLAIDGEAVGPRQNPYGMLRYKADRPVELTLNESPTLEGARKVRFQPISDESKVRYLGWVENNRRKVAEATGGRVGYIHVPDMSADGIYEFIKWYYPQIRKEGLIVDVRGNGGGNVSQMLVGRLSRVLLGARFSRNNDHPGTYPIDVFYGHLVCLINEDSASDGDIFPARFKKAGLGPLIGKRTWGGVTGITNRGPLIDGGRIYVPEFGTNDIDGSWIIEGEGVSPDIEVENDPRSVIEGRDPQLERGIVEVVKMMEAEPRTLPQRPAPPVKTR
jgi:tricorn protease